MKKIEKKRRIPSFLLALALICTVWPGSGIKAFGAEEKEGPVLEADAGYREMEQEWDAQGIRQIPGASYTVKADEYADPAQILTQNIPQGYSDPVVSLITGDFVQLKARVEKAGLYQIRIDYAMDDTSSSDASVSIQVNGKYPYEEAKSMILTRLLAPETYPYDRDSKGNEVMPEVRNVSKWQTSNLRTLSQKTTEGLLFYLNAGENNLTLSAEAGKIFLGNIYIESREEIKSYSQYKKEQGQGEAKGSECIVLEAEQMTYKNSATPRPTATRDVESVPYESSRYLLSTIGGETWRGNGEALYYEVNIEKAGWYNLSFKAEQTAKKDAGSQNIAKGNSFIRRSVTIDGKIPFQEAGNLKFPSTGSWEVTTLGDEAGNMPVYLTEGSHVLGIEVDVTELIPVAESVTKLNERVNQISLDIRKIIGNSSDIYRDWDLLEYMPDLKKDLKNIAEKLEEQIALLKEINQGNDKTKEITSLKIASKQLRKMADDPNQIPNHMTMLSEGTGSVSQVLGDVTEGMIQQPLSLDQIYLWQDEAELPDFKANAFTKLVEEGKYFFSSFKDEKGESKDGKEITIWVNRARTYIDLLEKMTDGDFTQKTGIKVNFSIMPNEQKLILANTTNTQPDVALGVSTHLPYDLAIRGALSDLRQFEDFNEVASRFSPGSMITHTFEEGIYALPETQDFKVLFYRKDLLEKLNITIPDTWDDVIEILPQLQRYGMNFYAPLSMKESFKTYSATLPFIYQKGATIYSEDGQTVALNSEEGLSAMKFMTDLYTIYGLPPQVANFYQSFRNGTIPIGISGFADYLKLDAAATELDGAWDIAVMPGFENEDGEVERWSTGGGQVCSIFSKSDMQEESWEFLKWWTSAEVQTEFGTQMSLLYGKEYLWNSANLEAFKEMPIDEEHKEVILDQWDWLYEFPKTPASYMVEREISNVWNKIVFDGENARSALDDSVILMNQELDRKLEEFGYRKNGKPVKDYEVPTIEKIESWVGRHEEK